MERYLRDMDDWAWAVAAGPDDYDTGRGGWIPWKVAIGLIEGGHWDTQYAGDEVVVLTAESSGEFIRSASFGLADHERRKVGELGYELGRGARVLLPTTRG